MPGSDIIDIFPMGANVTPTGHLTISNIQQQTLKQVSQVMMLIQTV